MFYLKQFNTTFLTRYLKMAEKRPYPDDGAFQNDSKRPRSAAGSPAPVANGASTAPANIAEQIAAAKARAAAVRERMANMNKPAGSIPSALTAGGATQSPAEAARAKIEAMKARVAAATAKSSAAAPPKRISSPMPTYQPPPPDIDDGFSRARGGLGIGLHPSLMADSNLDSRMKGKSTILPKFGTTMGNRRAESPNMAKGKGQLDLAAPTLEELKKNPYFDVAVLPPKARKSRELLFHQKGKFIAQAAALRRQAHLEEMKRRIAESARKAGLDDDRSEQAFLVTQPPDVEWWDEGLLAGNTYPDFTTLNDTSVEALCKITTEDSVITRYVQHPVLLVPPQDKTLFVPKPLPLTKTEQAKKRRQDRMERLKEQQAKVRLGLEPPEPPKIKKSNLMRVLGEQAVKDPTAVEMRVNREIAERREKHEAMNEDRALTKEQRAEKLAAQQAADAAKGLQVNVYRIDNLASGKHRYQIDINAKQHALTGITILNPKFNLVIVEGGAHSIAKYQQLMLKRILWTENAPPVSRDDAAPKGKPGGGKDLIAEASWLKPEDEKGDLRDLSDNQCILVWEGEIKQRMFKKWGSRVCETDSQARSALERAKAEFYWTKAKDVPRQ